MGIGDGVIPEILHQDVYQEIVIVTDEEALRTAKDLAAKEGLMCGITGGTHVAAALKMAKNAWKREDGSYHSSQIRRNGIFYGTV